MAEVKIIARPWKPQDLIDDLQELIDEESDNYLNTRRTTLCMARDYLEEYFATDNNVGDKSTPTDKDINVPSKWIPVTERLPEHSDGHVLVTDGEHVKISCRNACYKTASDETRCAQGYGAGMTVTHWMPLPEPPKGE